MASSLLCVSSATETVHIFRLSSQQQSFGGAPGASSPHASPHQKRHNSESPTRTSLDASDATFSDSGSLDQSSISSSPSNHAGPAGSGFDAYLESKRRHTGGAGLGSFIRRSSQGIGRTLAGAAGGYLPNAVTEMWEPARDFAFVKLPSAGVKSVVALSSSSPQIMVVTSEGMFLVYAVDLERGGECVLTKQYA